MLESPQEARVSLLFDTQSGQWNGELIDGIFVPDEAEVIKKILLA